MDSNALVTFDSLDDLYRDVCQQFCELVKSKAESSGRFSVALSGGSTPKRLYEMLAKQSLPWDVMHFFWGDERNVPHDDQDSNARMVKQALLDHVPVPSENVHLVPVDVQDPGAAAQAYEQELRNFFFDQEFPCWDLSLQGMGDDAHTASLFPETKAIDESRRWFVENWVPKFDTYRYTLTAPAINSADQIWFLISGAGKKQAVSQVLGENRNPALYPSQLIASATWFVTQDAIEAKA